MAYNCKIELNGNLGADAKTIQKDDKTFVALRVATQDSYPVKDSDKTIWKNKDTVLWHDVLVFRPMAVEAAKALTKGDRVEIMGSLAYRTFKDENGYNQQQASIIAGFVQKIDLKGDNEPTQSDINAAVEEVARS